MNDVDTILQAAKNACCAEYFSDDKRGYATPNELRDRNIETVYHWMGELIAALRNLANEENARRAKLPDMYVKCPHCKGYHDQKENIDLLCERCEVTTAPYRYDKTHVLI